MKIATTCFGVIAVALMALPAGAELISYEGFQYADGTDIGLGPGSDGGSGWSNEWTRNGSNGDPNSLRAVGGGLSYTDTMGRTLVTSGNYGLVDFNGLNDDRDGGGRNAQWYRNMDLSGYGAANMTEVVGVGGSYYISFIGERRGFHDPLVVDTDNDGGGDQTQYHPNVYARNAHFTLLNGGGLGEVAQIGNPSNKTTDRWTLRAKNAAVDDAVSDERFSYNQQFVVVKVTAGNLDINDVNFIPDLVEVWLNPDLSSEGLNGAPDMSKFILDNGVDPIDLAQTGVGLLAGSEGGNRRGAVMAFDEIRVGLDWESVTPNVPEPTSLALLSLCGLGLATRRRG
ncbi:hypothetical protein KOR34_50830 [Posidoniimonas corsicana]|uniref:Ice-binding protein C-terminal domain-containing protein n=1 Tax=Posidoniimonas corsicana TaxID=1938618 RepID=A0A5C5UWM2_9BACT|nr:PEP-CTERM sorting domain-containing protein [Posidoniimonas corsicana]TWT29765.1 hypothetical protein KOR34_50830 [Posidoniimonas corsicana]